MWRQELRWMRHVVRAQDQELRLDRWLRRQFPSLPQSFLQTQLRKRKIRLQSVETNGPATRAHSLLLEGSVVAIDAHLFQSKLKPLMEQQSEVKRQQQTLTMDRKKLLQLRQSVVYQDEQFVSVVYQDEQFVVLKKPHGLAVQDGSTLTESLDRYLPSLAALLRGDNDEEQIQLNLVHRLDKETSGVLVLARSRLAAATFSELMRSGAVQKTYEALVATSLSVRESYSRLKKFEGKEIKLPVDGKTACTLVERVLRQHDRTQPAGVRLQLRPRTGRKHQLRVHCAQMLRAPIIGDTKYGGRSADRLYLHAKRIRFPDPFNVGQFI
ncbi:Pseudouridine synthase, partial [Phytophthora megakarya]